MIFILKAALLVFGIWLYDVAAKPPISPAQTKDGDKLSTTTQKIFEGYFRYWVGIARCGNIGLFLLEAAILVVLQFGRAEVVPKVICPKLPSEEELSTISPLFILGMTCVYLGVFLRLWCYRSLGNLFTFEITIRPGHKLITHGPYSIVRHPSYLGIALLYNGLLIVEASPNSYLTSCGVFSTYSMAKWTFIGWVALLEWGIYSLAVVRPAVEDKNLKAEFGKEWEEYRERVPFKVIPGVF